MIASRRPTTRLFRASLLLTVPCLLGGAPSTAAAQERSHLRVQFDGGAAWTQTGPSARAPLPAGPGYANYAPTATQDNPLRALPQSNAARLRVKSLDGM